jgi:20S proteasome alpha/beta subunit
MSDSRVTDENSEDWGIKIFCPIPNVVVGASGITGIFSKFLRQIKKYVKENKVQSSEQLLEEMEDIVLKLTSRYNQRSRGQTLELIVAIKNEKEYGAELYHITPWGVPEDITTNHVIGSGQPYGAVFLKTTRLEQRTMKQTAEFGSFILHVIAGYGLDIAVDNKPQIWFIPYDDHINTPNTEELRDILFNSHGLGIAFHNFMRGLGKTQTSVETPKFT